MIESAATWATRLEHARETRSPIQPISDDEPAISVQNAYAIATIGIDKRRADGASVVGHKIGLTNTAVQEQLGVDQPDYGVLLSDMSADDGAALPAASFIAPRVELELAFLISSDLAGPGVTAEDVRRATSSVQPAIEIVDSRIADWRITLGDTIADNASAGAFVLGGEPHGIDEFDVAGLEVVLSCDGAPVETGATSAVLGDPCIAVAWLANALGELGAKLTAGDAVLSGACTRMVDAAAGNTFVGEFGSLGTIEISFVGS